MITPMKIIGYSERGAMNALFYGMAFDKEHGEESMKAFIKDIAKIEGNFEEFELYNEFSLSEFGDPDMVIIAKDSGKGQYVVFFIEAKRSGFKLSLEKDHHKRYMEEGKFENGHSSNLFFQLRLKRYFVSLYMPKVKFESEMLNKLFIDDKENRLRNSKNRTRTIGENVVVDKIVKVINNCEQDYYIAIIPDQESNETVDTSKYGFETHTITWEQIYSNSKFKDYLGKTLKFNQNTDKKKKAVSQILNRPIE
jgi:hypothetical protein